MRESTHPPTVHTTSRRRPIHRQRALAVAILLLCSVVASSAGAGEPPEDRSWTKKSFSVQGSWKIVEEGGARHLVLSDDFKTKSAPDLKLFLSKHSVKAAGNRNATQDAVLIAPLRSNKGGQRYVLPDDVDLGEYSSLLLHCEKYSKLWAAAELSSSP